MYDDIPGTCSKKTNKQDEQFEIPLVKTESFFKFDPWELKISKSETVDLFDYNSKTIDHRDAKLCIF